MDRTETYIKMSDCPEIQRQVISSMVGNPEYIFVKIGLGTYDVPYHMCWLPHQDQLQDMVDDSHFYKLAKFMAMLGYKTSSHGGLGVYEHQNAPRYFLDASMEQLWLAFVMKEKYNKVWNGDEWTLI